MSFEIGSLRSGRMTSGVSTQWSRRSAASLRYRSVVFRTSLKGFMSAESIFSNSFIRLESSLTSSARSFSTVPGYSGGYKELLHPSCVCQLVRLINLSLRVKTLETFFDSTVKYLLEEHIRYHE